MCRIHGIAYETLMEDEENQVRGYVHFADGQGVGFAYLTLFTIKEAVRIVKNGEVRSFSFTWKNIYKTILIRYIFKISIHKIIINRDIWENPYIWEGNAFYGVDGATK